MTVSSVKYFARFLKKYTWQECILVLLMLLTSLGALVSPYILKIIIDDVFPTRSFTYLIHILLIYLAIILARLIMSYVETYLFESVSNNIMKDIRMFLFSHLIRLPQSFFDGNKTGDIIHRVNSEVNSIQGILTGSVLRLINSACTLIGLTIMLCILNYKLFLLVLCVFPLLYINTRYFQPRIQRNIKDSREKDSEILSYLMERFKNIKLLKSFMCYRLEEQKLDQNISEQVTINIKNVRLSSTAKNISMLTTALIPILILAIGGSDVMAGTMTIGALVAYIQYTNRMFEPMKDLMGLYFDIIRASVSMDRIYEVIMLPQEGPASLSSGQSEDIPNGDIKFEHISFRYNSVNVLDNVSFELQQGHKYAIVGMSGCGKSTLINLLCRFYNPQEGSIRIGGTDINDIDLSIWRNSINLLTQDNYLFHDTIQENIIYGIGPTPSSAAIYTAAEQSSIHNHILSMPAGYDSIVGDHGVTLSGGQKQRIAIARSLLREANIVILDEATSALDSETEESIVNNLLKIYETKTIVIISHRLSSIRNVDHIICMDQGRIVEVGDHETLMVKKGYYWKLYKCQL